MLRRPRLSRIVGVLAILAARSADGQNLIPDPTFSAGLSAWMLRDAPLTTTLTWDPGPGADGAPGFATLTGAGPGAFFAGVCVPASAPDVVAPALTESVAFEVNPTSPNALRSVDFDNVHFGPRGTAPPTAAAGVPTVSAAALGIFALLLAVAGAWRVLKV